MDVQVENSGEEQDTKINLPKGFIWKVADAAKTKVMRILTPNLNFDHSGKNAFYSIVEWRAITICKKLLPFSYIVNLTHK